MNVILYRKWYLSAHSTGGFDRFTKITHKVDALACREHSSIACSTGVTRDRNNHPSVLSGHAYWVNDRELCVGYRLLSNPTVFRPIFSHRRQRLLDEVNAEILRPTNFWRAVRMRYWTTICNIKQLPLDCVDCIARFIY